MQVLIVDDQAHQRLLLRQILSELGPSVHVTDFADPVEALRWSTNVVPDLVILDFRMPKMDGIEFARRFRLPPLHRDVQMMLVTGVPDEPLQQAALEVGITEFLLKPVTPSVLGARCRKLLQTRERIQSLEARTQLLETQLRADQDATSRREQGLLGLLVQAACDRELREDVEPRRVARVSALIARAAGWSAKDVDLLESVAWLHDVGNIALPEGVLIKPEHLTAAEREVMRQHTVLGHRLLKESLSPAVQIAADIALCHHECWDGTGYPRGLTKKHIPRLARPVAIADVLSALVSGRPYRPAWDVERALSFVKDGAGTLFDPALVAALEAAEAAVVACLAEGVGQERALTAASWVSARVGAVLPV